MGGRAEAQGGIPDMASARSGARREPGNAGHDEAGATGADGGARVQDLATGGRADRRRAERRICAWALPDVREVG